MTEPESATQSLRARLATERALTQKQRELASANRKIAAQALKLSDELIERRRTAEAALSEAEEQKSRARSALTEMRVARSEQRIAERRLWASIESIEDGFAVFDHERRVIASNRAFFFPFSDLDGVGLGTTYGELVEALAEEGLVDTGPRRRSDWIAWMKSRWDGTAIEPVTLRFFNDRFVRLTERRTRDGDIVMLAINITRQIRHQKVLEEARQKAEGASRAKSAFLANMSHEIRTPMNGVLAMADLLAEGPLSEEQRLCVDTIRQSGEALLVIINDVLDYSKIEAQKLQIDLAPFDLEATISEVVTLLQPSAREKGLSLVVDYDMFLPTGFLGDKGRLRQVLMNLVGNAVKFTREGHVRVRVVSLPDDEPGMQGLHIAIEDTGIGIPEDKLDHIFGEFNQVDSAATRAFDGTGLGLAISRRLVELMGGEVWVDSTVGEGSVFGLGLSLPLGESAEEAPLSGRLAGRRAVVLDEDAARRAVVEKQLRALGLDPAPAAQGIAAEDIVLRASDSGPGGSVIAGVGPEAPGPDAPRLPFPLLRRALRAALADLAQAVPPAGPPVAAQRAMRVLCAEDNKTNQLVLRALLKDLRIELQIVANGAEAVEAYRAARPDIVFTDISMPVMDGREAARAIRAIEAEAGLPPVPLVAMTAHASEEDREASLRAGIDIQLTKPLKKPELLAQIAGARPDAALDPRPIAEPLPPLRLPATAAPSAA